MVIGTCNKIVFTNLYGTQILSEKIKMLQDLRRIKRRKGHLPWVVGGDFNIITSLSEKKGGQRRIDRDSNYFKEFIEDTKLIDMKNVNGFFTWSNKCIGKPQVVPRLDKFLISEYLLMRVVNEETNILSYGRYDHSTMLLMMK